MAHFEKWSESPKNIQPTTTGPAVAFRSNQPKEKVRNRTGASSNVSLNLHLARPNDAMIARLSKAMIVILNAAKIFPHTSHTEQSEVSGWRNQ
ncbi:MAG: hypothetical protein IID32_11590 [Planctomycetes bacterium]|nr:hypothetical protein [Planctomycetota bacterium]